MTDELGAAASRKAIGTVRVQISLPDVYASRRVTVAGDFTAWSQVDLPHDGEESFALELVLPRHRRWRYRLRLDDAQWINDPAADDYEPGADGAGVSIRRS